MDHASFPLLADYLMGKNPVERERLYRDIKILTRRNARIGMAPLDIALWDLAGKYHNASIHQLLGGYKESLPTYVATLLGEAKDIGGLDSPEAYADFAQQCLEMGYAGFKIHGWRETSAELEAANVQWKDTRGSANTTLPGVLMR